MKEEREESDEDTSFDIAELTVYSDIGDWPLHVRDNLRIDPIKRGSVDGRVEQQMLSSPYIKIS